MRLQKSSSSRSRERVEMERALVHPKSANGSRQGLSDAVSAQKEDLAWQKDKLGSFALKDFLGLTYVRVMLLGALAWAAAMTADWHSVDRAKQVALPRSVQLTYAFCAMAYGCNGFLACLRLMFENRKVRFELDCYCIYISALASSTYLCLSLDKALIQLDMKSVLFIPSRWSLYCCTMPAIWWILSHISSYSLRRKLYVFWLNWVMLVAGGIATIPSLSWGHKVFWMALSCVPFPELCFHLWRMVTDALDAVADGGGPGGYGALAFIRIYGQFSYQFFPAIYFAAFDGCIPLEASEPLWALCDWALKMVATSSLMEANFFTLEQRREWVLRLKEDTLRMNNINELSIIMERKDDFLAAISHELCTPLNGIIGLSDALLSDSTLGLPPTLVKTMSVIKISGKRLLQLIYDILDAAKMRQEGTISIKQEEVDIKALVADVVELASTLVHKGVQLRSDIQYVPKVIGDTGRVLQVLYNLVGNACKFTTSGFIRISSRYDDARKMVGVRVSDTGCGIRADKIQSIFEAYDQGDISTARRYGGTGLGLHLVGELMKAHNGAIDVESAPSEGSAFTVWFPLVPVQKGKFELNFKEPKFASQDDCSISVMAPRASTASPPPPSFYQQPPREPSAASRPGNAATAAAVESVAPPLRRQMSVDAAGLLPPPRGPDVGGGDADEPGYSQNTLTDVTDTGNSNASNRVVDWSPPPLYVGELLGQAQVMLVDSDNPEKSFQWLYTDGFSLVIHTTGEDAIKHLTTAELLPDVVMLASSLPDMDGCELVRAIRAMFPHYAIPIIMMSYDNSIQQMRAGLEAGCMDFIRRPCYQLELLCRIHIQLEARTPLRQRLRAGPGCLRALKLTNLPTRCRVDLAAGNQCVRRSYPHTAVLHMTVDWAALMERMVAADDHSPLLQIHQVFHDLTISQGLVPIHVAADGWTCMWDPDCLAPSAASSAVVVAGQLLKTFADARNRTGVPIHPSIAVAVGPVDTCLADLLDPCALHAIGPAVELAIALADAAKPDAVAAMATMVSPDTPLLSLPVGNGTMEVGVRYLNADQALDPATAGCVWDISSPRPQPIGDLIESMQRLKHALEDLCAPRSSMSQLPSDGLDGDRNAVTSSIGSTVATTVASRTDTQTDRSSQSVSVPPGAAQHPKRGGQGLATLVESDLPAPFPAASPRPLPPGLLGLAGASGAAASVVHSALRRVREAGLAPRVVAALPPLSQCLTDDYEAVTVRALRALPVSLLEVAFMSVADVVSLGVPRADAIRLLTVAKRCLTDALTASA